MTYRPWMPVSFITKLVRKIIERKYFASDTININGEYIYSPWTNNIFDWEYKDTKLLGYNSHPRIKFEIAV